MGNLELVKEIQKKNVEQMIPTGWNIYEWCEKHPDTTIAHSLKRIEKIMDFTDGGCLFYGFSAGKDSTVSANLAALELHLRHLRVEENIDRHGNQGVDPLDSKWYGKRLHGLYTDAEVCWTSSMEYEKRWLQRMGPTKYYKLGQEVFAENEWIRTSRGRMTAESAYEALQSGQSLEIPGIGPVSQEDCQSFGGLDLTEYNHFCLPMAWQNGCSFSSGVLISWSQEWGEDSPNHWVQPMPNKNELSGFEPIHIGNLREANAVPLESLSDEAIQYHQENGTTTLVAFEDLWGPFAVPGNKSLTEAVANYGRGPILPNFKPGCHEKEEQDDYSYDFSHLNWLTINREQKVPVKGSTENGGQLRLVQYPQPEEIKRRLEQEYDLSKDVWFLQPGEHGVTSTSLISLRAEESLDRRVILSQGEYSTGQYSRSGGTNVCSPVFDYSTADVWRLLSATDWDVNDIYQLMFEAGIGIGDQRVGSLLNYSAVRQIHTVKALEPRLYGRINQRFQNVEFMSQFSRSGYYSISRPKDSSWNGLNHLKAGYSEEEQTKLSDRYEHYLQLLEIPYERNGNEFRTADPALNGKPWFPFKDLVKNIKEAVAI